VRLPRQRRRMRSPQGVLCVFAACAAGAMVAASMACLMSAPWFQESMRATWLAWFSEQFSTCILIVPALLTAPSRGVLLHGGGKPIRLAPLLVLVGSLALSIVFGGPGAIAFPIA
ncbi:GGDEF domain-containing protein, partial [Pseudomonas shirazensis]